MRLSVIFIFCLLGIQSITSTVMLNCALGLVEERQCPVDGGWSLWSTWSNCEGQCSSVGRQVRTRNCSNPQPSNNGVDCVGNQFEVKGCGVPGCSYEQYEKHLAKDSNRLQQLKALKQASGSQSALHTKCLISHCGFETISKTLGTSGTQFWNVLLCVKENTGCPVAGSWGDWSEWSRCSALCGQGEQFRCRVCCDPPPSSTHTSCHGESCEFQSCTGTQCSQSQKEEGAWSNWSQWSTCSAPCRLGLTRRSRSCQVSNQKKAKKSLHPQTSIEELGDFDYIDYYENYLDDSDQDKEKNIYNENGFIKTDQLSKLKKRAGDRCDKPSRIEYFSTEDDEEYSITFSKSLIETSTMQVNPLTTNNLQNVQNLPETTQLHLKHSDITTSLSEHLLPESTKPTTEYSFPHSIDVKPTTKLLENSHSSSIEHSHTVCSEPVRVTSKPTKHLKQSKQVEKPPNKGKGKSAKKKLVCTTTTLLPLTKNLQAKGPTETCSSENDSEEGRYQIESNGLQETTVFEENECTDSLHKNKEDEISMFGNIEVNEKHAKGETKSDESNADGTEPTVNERKVDVTKSTIWTQDTSKSTCITIKPEDDILNLGKELALTDEPERSPPKTLKYSTKDITESLKSTFSSFMLPDQGKHDQASSNRPVISSTIASLERNDLSSVAAGKKTTDEESDFDNIADISNQRSCDIKKILQLPSYNDSFVVNDCKGPFEEIKSCNIKPCSKEGGWSNWSAWSPCSKECGLGKQVSARSCTQPEPFKSGSSCKGEMTRKRSCYDQICPVKVATPRAMMMSGESYIKYDSLHQHSSVFLLYFRFQHFNCSASLIFRKSPSHCENDHKCDLIHISLYNCYVLLVVRKLKCYTYFLSTVQLSVGEWHEILVTIVGATVTLRLDDSFVTHSENLSCRPLAPNFDSKMKVGGNFIGEIDQLRINFKNYYLQKKLTKRDILLRSEENVEPEEISQVQFSLNKEETTTLSLALFIHAPCFVNESSWRIEVALKPEFREGLLLFFRGYNQGEFVVVTLEHTRVRLQVKVLSEFGECEQPTDIAPHTWIHVSVSKQPVGPIGLAVNGGERCVVSFPATTSNAEEPSIRCTSGIFLGEVPTLVKRVMVNFTGESDSLKSPLGLLGSLTVDEHLLDLSRLPHKIASDIASDQSSKHYKSSSDTASATVHYEEMFILDGDPFSLVCLYDLSSEQTQNSSNTNRRHSHVSESSASWIKLDLPVETAFETNGSNVTYYITDSGKSLSLNVTHYADFRSIEGFYSCWLQYPLPLQPGLNIITYSVVVITDNGEVSQSIKITVISNIIFILVLLLLCVAWFILEAIQNVKKGLGFYRCKKLAHEKAIDMARSVILGKQGTKLLGNTEAANESYQKCLAQMDADMMAREFEKEKKPNELDTFVSDASDDDDAISVDDEAIIAPDRSNVKGIKRQKNTTVAFVSQEQHTNPFFTKNENQTVTKKPSYLKIVKGKVFNPSKVSIDDLQSLEDENTPRENESDNELAALRNYSIYNSTVLKKKEVGLIQETPAYKSIENELKFKPEKFKSFDKYNNRNKSNK